jgi:S1-C subfamily serine protease
MGGTVSTAEQRPGRAVASFAAALYRGGAVIRAGAVVLVLALLAVAGVLTHFDAGAGGLPAADRDLMHMQRMGPPPDLQAAYEELRADTVTVQRPGASRPMAAGVFVGTLAVNPALPGVASIFPGTIKKLMATLSGPAYDAVFAIPLTPALPQKVAVDLDGSDLPGTVSYENSALDLAAVKVLVSQSELGKLIGPPIFFNQPSGPTDLRRLIIRLGLQPGRAAGYVFTSGILESTGLSQCETSISPGESGSPIGWVSLQGTLVLAGLAVPSADRGHCGVIGSWLIAPFLQLMIANHKVTGSGAFLGVLVQNGPVAGRLANGRSIPGAYVTSVIPGGPAAVAGVRPGDVIVRLGNVAVRSGKALEPGVGTYQPGTAHWLTVIRDGRRLRIRVELGREGA